MCVGVVASRRRRGVASAWSRWRRVASALAWRGVRRRRVARVGVASASSSSRRVGGGVASWRRRGRRGRRSRVGRSRRSVVASCCVVSRGVGAWWLVVRSWSSFVVVVSGIVVIVSKYSHR
ncbi:hypothetical protein ACXZ9C_10540 [Streptococcus agalactiae]